MGKAKAKSLKRLINNKTLSEAIKALTELEKEGFGNSIIQIGTSVKTHGFAYTTEPTIALITK